MTTNHEDVFHPDTREAGVASAFWWVEGTPLAPMYCACLLWRTRRCKVVVASYQATTSAALAWRLLEEGWEEFEPSEVARLAEGAGRSQHITKNRAFVSEISDG